MTTEVDPRGALGHVPDAPQLPAEPAVPDHIRDVRLTRRWTRIGVYTALLVSLPVRHFLVGSSITELLASFLVGVIIAAIAIEGAFTQGFKLKKRSAYPEDVFLQLGALPTFDVGCQAAVAMMDRLLRLKGSFLALRSESGFLSLVALSSVSRVNADRYLRLGAACVQRALSTKEVVALRPGGDFPTEIITSPGQHVVFVPVQSFRGVTGILGLLAERSTPDLRDTQLLISVGYAVGVSLESLCQRDELRAMATIDELTRVYNRRYFFDQLDRELAAARRYSVPVSVLILDLDGLKGLNDSFGHETGDEALRTLAQRLVRYSRASDIVARLGGDEFAVILSRTDSEDAAQIARRLQSSVEDEVAVVGKDGGVRIAVSFGFASFPEDAEDAGQLLRHADGRMYAAKAARSGPARKRRKSSPSDGLAHTG
jgi:diguanylate cyclase (GGDEF)-like protein